MGYIAEASRYLIPALWLIWAIGWTAGAFRVKRTQWRETHGRAVYNRIPVLLGVIMLLRPNGCQPDLPGVSCRPARNCRRLGRLWFSSAYFSPCGLVGIWEAIGAAR